MKQRKYTNIRILTDVYCSSTHHYGFTVYCHDAKRGYKLDYCPSIGLTYFDKRGRPCAKSFPKYVIDEVERLIYEAYSENRLMVYEVDREGNRRRSDYRYHSDEWLALNLESLVKANK